MTKINKLEMTDSIIGHKLYLKYMTGRYLAIKNHRDMLTVNNRRVRIITPDSLSAWKIKWNMSMRKYVMNMERIDESESRNP